MACCPEARAAFDEYRARYPKGKLMDAALYWGGEAAQTSGEGMAAALLWEQLIAGFRQSSFRGTAMQQTAEIYAKAGQYAKALDMYTRFISEYPDEARAARADIRLEQVRYLAQGQGDKEAELSAIIARETGDRKRQATIDLARLYIYSGDTSARTPATRCSFPSSRKETRRVPRRRRSWRENTTTARETSPKRRASSLPPPSSRAWTRRLPRRRCIGRQR